MQINDEDKLIICHVWKESVGHAHKAFCAVCNTAITAFRVSIEKAKQDSTFHLICIDCYFTIFAEEDVLIGGVIMGNDFNAW